MFVSLSVWIPHSVLNFLPKLRIHAKDKMVTKVVFEFTISFNTLAISQSETAAEKFLK